MTFIKEITPHIERIRLHKEGGRITSIEILREIAGIHFTHIRSNDFDIPTNLGCGSCVAHMINQLVGKIDRDMKTYELKVEEESDNPISEFMTFPKQEPKKDKFIYTVENTTRKELVAICKENGIKTGKIKSSVLVDKINNL